MTTQNFEAQGITVASRSAEGQVGPEIVLYDYRPDQKDTYFSGREELLKLRAAINYALGENQHD